MSIQELWCAVFIAAIRSGNNDLYATYAADRAVTLYRARIAGHFSEDTHVRPNQTPC